MDNEKLIEIVRGYKFLYDVNDKRYTDNLKKDAAWREIAIKLNTREKNCKKAWGLLRDSFRRSIKKQRKCALSNIPCRKWKYEEQMAFLLPHLKKNLSLCSVKAEDERRDGCDIELDDEASLSSADHSPGELLQDNKSSPPIVNTFPVALSKPQQKVSFKPRKLTRAETPSTVLMKYILNNKKKLDDIEQFFTAMALTVQTFPLRDRAIAKAKVFKVISEMEIDFLSKPSTSASQMSPLIRTIAMDEVYIEPSDKLTADKM